MFIQIHNKLQILILKLKENDESYVYLLIFFIYNKLFHRLSVKDIMKSILISILLYFVVTACSNKQQQKNSQSNQKIQSSDGSPNVQFDLKNVKNRDTLIAVVNNSSTSYFIYKGQPMGFEYELLDRLAKYLDVGLHIEIEKDIGKAMQMLHNGEADIVAHKLTITKDRKELVAFTNPHYSVKQVLVQQKPENWQYMDKHQIEAYLIRNPVELVDKPVYLKKNSSYVSRMQKLADEISGDINIIEEAGEIGTEALIKRVARGEIDYTVADDDIASVNKSYYPILDIKTEISAPQKIAWAVRKSSPDLLKAINNWLYEIKQKPDFNVIYRKYFVNTRTINTRADSENTTINEGNKISQYDALLIAEAEKLGWDWKLLAALVYEESRFDYNEVSWMGAVGLMQVVPTTAASFGNYNLYIPEHNIKAGTAYLKWLQNYWKSKVPDEQERLRFILASYNAGQGHVIDAMNLADKYGRNPYIWEDNVEYYLLQKSKSKYYTDPVVKMGYCRGEEPVNYVEDVLQVYNRYIQLIVDKV